MVKVICKCPMAIDGIAYKTGDELIMKDEEVSQKKITNLVTVIKLEDKKIKEVK